MTDRTHPDSGRTTGGIVEMLRDRIVELEAQLESIGAGGVSGPLVGQQTRDTFTAADMATAEARGFRDGVASVAASATAPSAHIKEPYTLAEIKAKIASNDYGAELLLQHAMALLDGASLAASAGSEPVAPAAVAGCANWWAGKKENGNADQA